MNKYRIYPATYDVAQKLGVIIKPSQKKNKKIDVYDLSGKYLVSVGDSRYMDYHMYLRNSSVDYANERRKLYKLRHAADRKVKYSPGWFADRLLW